MTTPTPSRLVTQTSASTPYWRTPPGDGGAPSLEPFLDQWGREGLRRARIRLVSLAVLVFPFVVLVAALAVSETLKFTGGPGKPGDLVAAYIFATAMAAGWGSLLVGAAKSRPGVSAAWKTLVARSQDVVWVYEHRIEGGVTVTLMQRWVGLLVFALRDGKRVVMPMPGGQIHHAWDHLVRALPRATFGYSRVSEARFRETPASLSEARS